MVSVSYISADMIQNTIWYFSDLLFNWYSSKYVSTSNKYNLVAGAGADGPFNALCVFNVATNADLNILYARFILCLGFKICVGF